MEQTTGDWLDEQCVPIYPWLNFTETIGDIVDEEIDALDLEGNGRAALSEYGDVDENMITDLLMQSMTDFVGGAGAATTASLDAALMATPAGPALIATKIAFHYACMKYDEGEDGYVPFALEKFDENCRVTSCLDWLSVDWRWCATYFPVQFLESLDDIGC